MGRLYRTQAEWQKEFLCDLRGPFIKKFDKRCNDARRTPRRAAKDD